MKFELRDEHHKLKRGSEIMIMVIEYSESFVKEHIDRWVNTWNNHDLKLSFQCIQMMLNSPVRKSKRYFQNAKYQKLPTKKSLRNIGPRH